MIEGGFCACAASTKIIFDDPYIYLFVDSMMYDKDAGHRVFMEDVYENQMRIPGANWIESSRPWTNVVCKFNLISAHALILC